MAKKPKEIDTPVLTGEKLLEILVRLQLRELGDEMKQKDLVELLHDCQCTPKQIEVLLNVPTTTVNPILSRKRKAKKG